MQVRISQNLKHIFDMVKGSSPCALAAHAGVLPFVYAVAPEAEHRRAYESAMVQDAAQLTELAELQILFAEQGIPCIPLKGCVLKPIYPGGSFYRTMCDLDLLCREEDAARIRVLLTARGYHADAVGEYHHDEYSLPPFLHVEMHRALTPDTERSGAYYASHDPWDRATRREDGTWDMPLEDHYLFIVAHFLSHLLERGGSSLRGLVDLYVFRQQYPALDMDYIRAALEEMGIAADEEKYVRMAYDLFDGEEPQIDLWREELAFMIESGSFGTAAIRAARRREQIGGSRLHYIWVRMFPPRAHMYELFPFLKRHRWLLPFYYLRRLITFPFKHKKALKAEWNELKK